MKTVHGAWAPGFEWVREAFAKNLSESEVGAACCVYWKGEPVIDVWGGLADRDDERPWQRDTAALVFSSTKGVTAALIHLLAQRNQLELGTPAWCEST